MLPPCNFYWFRINIKHMAELWLDQVLMNSAYRSEMTSYFCYNIQNEVCFFKFCVHLTNWQSTPWGKIESCLSNIKSDGTHLSTTYIYINISRDIIKGDRGGTWKPPPSNRGGAHGNRVGAWKPPPSNRGGGAHGSPLLQIEGGGVILWMTCYLIYV